MFECNPDIEITLWDAWWHWWRGAEVKECSFWLDQTILFWARLGKLLQFAGGLVVVLDLLGSQLAPKAANFFSKYGLVRGAMAGLAAATIMFATGFKPFDGGPMVLFWWGLFVALPMIAAAELVAFAIRRGTDNPHHPVRWVAFGIAAIGFQFDLLGS